MPQPSLHVAGWTAQSVAAELLKTEHMCALVAGLAGSLRDAVSAQLASDEGWDNHAGIAHDAADVFTFDSDPDGSMDSWGGSHFAGSLQAIGIDAVTSNPALGRRWRIGVAGGIRGARLCGVVSHAVVRGDDHC
jgi:hypothetical protein